MRIRLSAYIAIQLVPSAWSMWPPVGSWALRSNTPMLSSPRKPPWNMLRPSASLRFTHQVKFSMSLWNTRSRNSRSPRPPLALAVDLVHAPRGPGVHRRVHVAEGPLVGRHLAVRVHVPLAREQHELLLRELGVQVRERNGVKRQVPGGVPRVLPLVRHRDDVGVVQVSPLAVAAIPAVGGRCRVVRVAVQPFRHVVIEVLLAPDHSGEGLALDRAGIGPGHAVLEVGVERVGLGDARRE